MCPGAGSKLFQDISTTECICKTDVGCTGLTVYFALLLLSLCSELCGVSFSGSAWVVHWAKRYSERAVAASTFSQADTSEAGSAVCVRVCDAYTLTSPIPIPTEGKTIPGQPTRS